MEKQLNGKTYVRHIQNVAYLCLGIPLLFFIYLYLESSVDQLEAKIPEEYQLMLFIPFLLLSAGMIIWGMRKYRAKVAGAIEAGDLKEKLTIYQKGSMMRFLVYGISSLLITFGFYLTDFQAFAALFGIMLVLFSINNPNAGKIAGELKLKNHDKEVILKGLDIS